MRRRSNLLVLLGLAAFVLGLLFVYVITSDDDDDGGGGGGEQSVEVLVANEELPAGTRGDSVLQESRFRLERVDAADLQPDALRAPSQLSGQVLTLTFAEGEQIRTSGLRSLGGPRAEIPEGFEAVSVNVGFVAGGANTIQPGDRVNVFLVMPDPVSFTPTTLVTDAEGPPPEDPYATPRAELLLTNTLVLDVQIGSSSLQVSQPQQGTTATGQSGGNLVVVLAVNTLDAEKVIFGSSASGTQLYLSRVRLDAEGNPAPPAGDTPGRDFFTVLAEEAGAAFQRSNP